MYTKVLFAYINLLTVMRRRMSRRECLSPSSISSTKLAKERSSSFYINVRASHHAPAVHTECLCSLVLTYACMRLIFLYLLLLRSDDDEMPLRQTLTWRYRHPPPQGMLLSSPCALLRRCKWRQESAWLGNQRSESAVSAETWLSLSRLPLSLVPASITCLQPMLQQQMLLM